jgi:hypothetical protein
VIGLNLEVVMILNGDSLSARMVNLLLPHSQAVPSKSGMLNLLKVKVGLLDNKFVTGLPG